MKRFYRLLCALLAAGAVVATACSESGTEDTPKQADVAFDSGTQDQTVYADTETANAINFTAKAAWTATVTALQVKAEGGSSVEWLTLDKYSGQAGSFSLKMSLKPNYTGETRKAQIGIVSGETSISTTIEQKGTNKDGTQPQDPDKPDDNPPSNIQFPDAKFAAYMVENFDTNKDGGISPAEAAAITRIECPRMEIESLEGIEYCTELTYLDCGYNKLKTLDISKNTKLTELVCWSNQLTTLNVSGCPNLTCLRCIANQLTTLDVSNNPELTELYCAHNQLTTLDTSKNAQLTKFDYADNQLPNLDVSKNTELTELGCALNQLTTLNVSKNTKLTKLVCSQNQLTAIDVSKNTQLTDLTCDRNQLTTLDVSNNTKLTNLNCVYNQMTALDVSKNTELTKLSCSHNQLTTLDVSKTNLGNSSSNHPLSCYRATLQTLWLKTGWQLNGINKDRSTSYIHPKTEIKYKD